MLISPSASGCLRQAFVMALLLRGGPSALTNLHLTRLQVYTLPPLGCSHTHIHSHNHIHNHNPICTRTHCHVSATCLQHIGSVLAVHRQRTDSASTTAKPPNHLSSYPHFYPTIITFKILQIT